jgi:hypothetical protein
MLLWAFPPPASEPVTEYTLSDRSREARAPPEPVGFQPEPGLSARRSTIFREPLKAKSLPGLATLEGFRRKALGKAF